MKEKSLTNLLILIGIILFVSIVALDTISRAFMRKFALDVSIGMICSNETYINEIDLDKCDTILSLKEIDESVCTEFKNQSACRGMLEIIQQRVKDCSELSFWENRTVKQYNVTGICTALAADFQSGG
jgi:hypothetical protein